MTEIFRKYFIGLGIVLDKIWGALEKHPGVVVVSSSHKRFVSHI